MRRRKLAVAVGHTPSVASVSLKGPQDTSQCPPAWGPPNLPACQTWGIHQSSWNHDGSNPPQPQPWMPKASLVAKVLCRGQVMTIFSYSW